MNVTRTLFKVIIVNFRFEITFKLRRMARRGRKRAKEGSKGEVYGGCVGSFLYNPPRSHSLSQTRIKYFYFIL